MFNLDGNNITIAKGDSLDLTFDCKTINFIDQDNVLFTLKNHSGALVFSKNIEMHLGDVNVAVGSISDAVELYSGIYYYDLVLNSGDQRFTITKGELIITSPYHAYMVNLLHSLYRNDSWINQLFRTISLGLEEILTKCTRVHENSFFDTVDADGLNILEKEADIFSPSTQSIADRRAVVQAKWLSNNKATLAILQQVANSWRNGLISVGFVDGKIKITFNSPIGIPQNLQDLKDALEKVKPAHLPIWYVFAYWFWQDTKDMGTWGEHKNAGTWNAVKQIEE